MVARAKKPIVLAAFLIGILVFVASVYGFSDFPPYIIREGDLNNNGIEEKYILEKYQLKVYEEGQIIWQSPKEYKVDQLSIGDVTGDGKDNLAICVWKTGSFGKYRPFWHEGRDDEYKHHLFIYEFRDGTYKPKWFSSSLVSPLVHMEIIWMEDRDAYNLLVVEGGYKKGPLGKYKIDKKADKESKLWQWDQWGFSLLFSSELDQENSE